MNNDQALGNLRGSALPSIADDDGPAQIGNPNLAPEAPANARPGQYQSTRTETGSSVASGRGSLSNTCENR
jgi:hypothetical protein